MIQLSVPNTKILCPFMLLGFLCGVASASLHLDPGGAGLADGSSQANALAEILTGTQTSQAQINVAIAPYLGASIELYKQDNPTPESGPFAGSYSTTFTNSGGNFEIAYDGGSAITGATHLLVKDGNQNPAWYLYAISGLWDGTSSIFGYDFWPSNGSISHVTIYGREGVVPEPGTMFVWSGIAAMASGMVVFSKVRRS